MRIVIDSLRPKPRAVHRTLEILNAGGVIVYPTDTVYGLGCAMSNKKGIERINSIKAETKPRSIMLADLKNISSYAQVSNKAYKFIKNIMPGPYTAILPATRMVPRLLQSNRKTIGVRIADHWFCHDLISALGEPLITTSVPMAKGGVHVDPVRIDEEIGHAVDAVVDSGMLADIPSTIIAMETDEYMIIREGLGPVPTLE